jgi:uncharacterized protein YutE (UPF0331/DUF86 family)
MPTPDDVILNKAEIVERCLRRITEIHGGDSKRFREELLYQDALLMNIERACQAAIDLGMRWVRLEGLGVPKESKDAFVLLAEAKKIPRELAEALQKMVGFRNVAVYDYRALDFDIVLALVQKGFPDLRELIRLGLERGSS